MIKQNYGMATVIDLQALKPDEGSPDRRRRLLETAARLICERGFDATSMGDIATACGLTKAGLYYHVRSKDELLFEIMSWGMDVFEEQVLSQVAAIPDPLERLETCMELNVLLVTRGWSKEVTIILHEHDRLSGEAGARINARKKRYLRFLERAFAEAVACKRLRPVHPKVAAFSFLGSVLWVYKWYKPDGAISPEELAAEMKNVFFGGLAPTAAS